MTVRNEVINAPGNCLPTNKALKTPQPELAKKDEHLISIAAIKSNPPTWLASTHKYALKSWAQERKKPPPPAGPTHLSN